MSGWEIGWWGWAAAWVADRFSIAILLRRATRCERQRDGLVRYLHAKGYVVSFMEELGPEFSGSVVIVERDPERVRRG